MVFCFVLFCCYVSRKKGEGGGGTCLVNGREFIGENGTIDCFGPNVHVESIFTLIYQEIASVTYYHHVTHKIYLSND